MSMDSQVARAAIFPGVRLIDANADQVRHHLRKTVVVVPFHPYDFDFTLGIRKFPNVTEKLPMFFLQTAEVQVGKNVAQQDQPVEGRRLQHLQGSGRTAQFGAQMQIRKNDGVSDNHHA